MRVLVVMCALLAIGTAVAGPPWKAKNPDPSKWTNAEIEQILSNSPWSQTANAAFPEQRDDEQDGCFHDPIFYQISRLQVSQV